MSVDYATRCTNADVTATYIEQSGGKHTYSQRIHTGEAQWTIPMRACELSGAVDLGRHSSCDDSAGGFLGEVMLRVVRLGCVVERWRGDWCDGRSGGGREVGSQVEMGGDQVVAVDEIVPPSDSWGDLRRVGAQPVVDNSAQAEG